MCTNSCKKINTLPLFLSHTTGKESSTRLERECKFLFVRISMDCVLFTHIVVPLYQQRCEIVSRVSVSAKPVIPSNVLTTIYYLT